MKFKDSRFSSINVIRDITSMRRFAKVLLGKGKIYDSLLELIIEKDYYYDELPYPKLKDICNKLSINNTQLRKQLKLIYNDLKDKAYDGYFKLEEVEYSFHIHGDIEFSVIKMKDIPKIPRVGENIEIPYFKERLGTSYYYVEAVSHEFTDKKQIICFRLKPGWYNRFWDIRKGEADLKREFTWKEQMELDDYGMMKKLGYR